MLYLLICAFLIVLPLWTTPKLVGVALLIIKAGIPVYFVCIYWKGKPRWIRKLTRKYSLFPPSDYISCHINRISKKTYLILQNYRFNGHSGSTSFSSPSRRELVQVCECFYQLHKIVYQVSGFPFNNRLFHYFQTYVGI